jgi:putative transposase
MGTAYCKGAHSKFKLEAHIVWVTKYRHKVLKGKIAIDTRELIKRICAEQEASILSGVVSSDHVHICISYDPSTSISTLVQQLKGKTSRLLQIKHPELGKRYWGQHLWARGYFAVSVGNVSEQVVKEYLEHHFNDLDEAEDSFKIQP